MDKSYFMTKCGQCVFATLFVLWLIIVAFLVTITVCAICGIAKMLGSSVVGVEGASALLGVSVAIIGLVKGVLEYREYKQRQRIQYLIDFGKKYTEDKDINSVVKYLEYLEDHEGEAVDRPDIHQVELYMRFFEELQFLIEKKAIDKKDTYYLFGHYTKVLKENWQSEWPSLGYNEKYWEAFRTFEREQNIYNK